LATPAMEGILLVDKPRGPTSHDIVHRVRMSLGNEKVGHTGTLDPAASGLLILCIGRMTRTARLFTDLEKEYSGTILFGRQTDTLDIEGKTNRRSSVPESVVFEAAEWARSHTGTVLQEAPQYSARKWKGKPLHRYAREGKETPISEKIVSMRDVEIRPGRTKRRSDFRIVVSSGFFVRSWIRDLGIGINVATTLGFLRRERIGPFQITHAVSPEGLTREMISRHLVPGKEALSWIPELDLPDEGRRRLQQGGFISLPESTEYRSGDTVKIVNNGDVLVLARVNDSQIRPWIVLRSWEST